FETLLDGGGGGFSRHGEFAADAAADRRRVNPEPRIRHHAADPNSDDHAAAPSAASTWKSASLIGFSSFRNSIRAASSTIGIVTAEADAAARKAALSAMLWILPPVKFNWASRSRSRTARGMSRGNTLAQIVRRSVAPGEGKS